MNTIVRIELANNAKEIAKLQMDSSTDGQVTIHILHQACYSFCTECNIEVYQDIHLIPDSGLKRSELIHIENRTSTLKFKTDGEFTRFTLIFSALPKHCRTFDFIEPGERGWRLLNIQRNDSDVYNIKIHKEAIHILNKVDL